jgi:hypothetical protein
MYRKLLQPTLLVLALFYSIIAMATEEPKYTLLASKDGVEYRQYAPYLVAETVIEGEADRDTASSLGFRRLFKYISGDNTTRTSVAMTAPVQQTPSRKIDMTAPVQQTPAANGWKVGFTVPGEFTEATVPKPTNAEISIRAVPGQLMAVIQYSGRWTDKNLKQHSDELLLKIASAGINAAGEVISAAYNAPFTPPFMRRNEVMIAVDRVPLP